MTSSKKAEELLASGFFEDRILVEIEAFDPSFFFGVSPKRTLVKHRHLGHFMFTTSIVVHGRIIAPKAQRGLPARIWMSPLSPELLAGHGRYKNVGRFGINPDDPNPAERIGTFYFDETERSYLVTCLAQTWKYLDIWVHGNDDYQTVDIYSFYSKLHPNLDAWIAEE